MVMAMDDNKLIGKAGGLPWYIAADLKHFQRLTTGKAIIMGRRTYTDDIKRPLPKRENIVVSRDAGLSIDGVYVVQSLEAALALAAELTPAAQECCVIGGAELCRAAMASTERLYLTVVHGRFDGDTWLDSFEFSDWTTADRRSVPAGVQCEWAIDYYTLDRA